MFGTRKIPEVKNWKLLMNSMIENGGRYNDQDFLRDTIYPIIVNDSLVHASFHKMERHAKDFPIKHDSEYRFVGEYVYHDESRSKYHIDELKKALKN
jgi:hypothetical protein